MTMFSVCLRKGFPSLRKNICLCSKNEALMELEKD